MYGFRRCFLIVNVPIAIITSMDFRSFTDMIRWASRADFAPVMLVVSDEFYLQQQIERQLVQRFYDGTAPDFNYQVLYGSETSGSEVAGLASAYPMMAERRVVIVRDADKLLKEKDALAGYIKKPVSSTFLLFMATKVNRTTNPWRAVPKDAVIEQPAIYENQVREWIPQLASAWQLSINEEAVEFIIQSMGTAVSMIAAEFEKMSLADIPGRKLTTEVVADLTGIRREWNPWELKDAIVKGDEARAQLIATKMIQSGDNPVGMAASLAVSFKSMWMKSWQLATDKNMPPPQRYPEKIELEQVKALGPRAARKIEHFIDRLADLDAGLKGFSPLPPDIQFCAYISDVCNVDRRED